MTDDQLEEILALWKSGRLYQAGTHASDLVAALRSAWVTNARLRDHAAFLNLENAETKAKFKLLESHLRSEVRSELITAAFTEGTLKAGDAMRDRMLQVEKERDESRAALAKQKEESGYPRLTEVFHQQAAELKAANETIDMLYERAGRFAAQADKYEQELKVAKAAILQVQSRLDDALALLSAKSAQLETVLAKRLELGGDLEAADQKIDELQERSAWFEAERHKDQLRLKSAEDEIKAAKEEKAEAIRLGDERLAELWDMKQKEIQSLKAEIIRLRRHLGEIP